MKLGIIGTGKIVEDALFAIEPVSQIELKAIFAREHSRQKAEDFAARYKILEVYTDYDGLLEKADVDTVYIGLINSVHYEYAKKALLKDKNVILEKPFAGTYDEAAELINLARSRKLFVFQKSLLCILVVNAVYESNVNCIDISFFQKLVIIRIHI